MARRSAGVIAVYCASSAAAASANDRQRRAGHFERSVSSVTQPPRMASLADPSRAGHSRVASAMRSRRGSLLLLRPQPPQRRTLPHLPEHWKLPAPQSCREQPIQKSKGPPPTRQSSPQPLHAQTKWRSAGRKSSTLHRRHSQPDLPHRSLQAGQAQAQQRQPPQPQPRLQRSWVGLPRRPTTKRRAIQRPACGRDVPPSPQQSSTPAARDPNDSTYCRTCCQ